MANVPSLLRLVLLGLIGAAIVHITVLLLVPVFSDTNAWTRIEATTTAYRFEPLDRKRGLSGDGDPLIREAVCRFDLADGPVHLTAERPVPYWSLSIYAPNGDNLYSLNDSVSGEKRLNLIVADPIGMASLRASDARAGASEDATTGTTTGAQDGAQPVAPSLGNSIPVEQDIGEGMAVLRVFMPDATWQGEVQRFLDGARCVTLGGG